MSIVKSLLENDLPDGEPINRREKKAKPTPRCARCGSTIVNEVLNPVTSVQYSKLFCAICGKFIQQGQDPAITKASEERDRQILAILDNFELPHHEEKFLNDQLYKRFATEGQRAWMDRISMRTLEKTFDWGVYNKNAPK